ncbi:MAG: Ig domain-containing protein, partial [Xanthomonadales bacterium]|nr:Ig domain-containing protein [Xanthomonadales bacterium]
MALPISASDADGDVLTIHISHMPPGASYNDATHTLAWTPGYDQAGNYSDVTVTVSDGALTTSQRFDITVEQAQPDAIMPEVSTQILHVGQAFSMRLPGHLPDDLELADGVTVKPLHYAPMPPYGMQISDTGLLTWTPEQEQLGKHKMELGFEATYKPAINNDRHITTHIVEFDVLPALAATSQPNPTDTKPTPVATPVSANNHAPTIHVSNHLVIYGYKLSVPIVFGGTAAEGIGVRDPDGAAQTRALAISFTQLPADAHYDAAKRLLTWSPQDIPAADVSITVQVSDGQATAHKTFSVRVVPSPYAADPGLVLDFQPSTAAVPGQLIRVSAHGETFADIASITAQVRGSGMGSHRWHAAKVSPSGQFQIQSTHAGKIDVRVTVTDVDGHRHTQDTQLRVKDPANTNDLALVWYGVLRGSGPQHHPASISNVSAIKVAAHASQTRSDYRLQIAPLGSDHWQTLAHGRLATDGAQPITLTQLDPATLINGVYQLRLIAWDRSAHSSEIRARIAIASTTKTPLLASAADITYTLGGHAIALQRTLAAKSRFDNDFGNWQWIGIDSHFSNDQTSAGAGYSNPAWAVGARIWLNLPADLAHPATSMTPLTFILKASPTTSEDQTHAHARWRVDFGSDHGWTLTANNSDDLLLKGKQLYAALDNAPWAPLGYVLSAPDGTHYTLDSSGVIIAVRFSDGVHWLVSDAGIVLVGTPGARISLLRDHHGRIVRVTGPAGTMAYAYDDHGRLILARAQNANDDGTRYAYNQAGVPIADASHAHSGKPTLIVASHLPSTLTHVDLAVSVALASLIKQPQG